MNTAQKLVLVMGILLLAVILTFPPALVPPSALAGAVRPFVMLVPWNSGVVRAQGVDLAWLISELIIAALLICVGLYSTRHIGPRSGHNRPA